jgi:hypothetical protein
MEVFVWRGKKFRAWSDGVQCNQADPRRGSKREPHTPHVFDSEYTIHGPYFCWGYPSYKNEDPEPEVFYWAEALQMVVSMWKQLVPPESRTAADMWHLRAILRALGMHEPDIDKYAPRPKPKHRKEPA